jgi:release factor glutamine methyltransferase
VVATDASQDALSLAAENAARCGLDARLDLRLGTTWGPVAAEERFDVIASNPPYVGAEEESALAPEVREWEPASALYAGVGGMDVLRDIVEGAGAHLHSGGLLALEVGATQAGAVRTLLERSGEFADIRIVRDLAERERVVTATRAPID